MADKGREHDYYRPAGIPVTPQARRFGYEFPVYVSDHVWKTYCAWSGPSRLEMTTDRRVQLLLAHCYEAMIKRLSVRDDFVFYPFKIWYWPRDCSPKLRKMKRARLGCRLFLDEDNSPWMYIFDMTRDRIEALEKVDPPEEEDDGSEDDIDRVGDQVHPEKPE